MPGVPLCPVMSNVQREPTDTAFNGVGGVAAQRGKRNPSGARGSEVLAYTEPLAKEWKIPGESSEIPSVEVLGEVPRFLLSRSLWLPPGVGWRCLSPSRCPAVVPSLDCTSVSPGGSFQMLMPRLLAGQLPPTSLGLGTFRKCFS